MPIFDFVVPLDYNKHFNLSRDHPIIQFIEVGGRGARG
jgi:hypothetical protein